MGRRFWTWAAFAAASVLAACADEDRTGGNDDGADLGTHDPQSIRFEPADTLTLTPGEQVAIEVAVSPASSRRVTFGLLAGDPSELHDASLDATEAVTGSDGLGSIHLRASSVAATFLVRASLDDSTEARRAVSVSATGFGKLVVHPEYKGKRELGEWTVSARAGVTCLDLVNPLSDGPLLDQGKAPLTIPAVPVGPDIALTVRAGSLAAGCVTVKSLEPDEQRTLTVPVTDLPLHIDEGSLQLTLGIETSTAEFDGVLSQATDDAVAGFVAEQLDDAAVLLGDIAAAITNPDRHDEFVGNRSSQGFDALVLAQWASPTLLRERVRVILELAAERVVSPSTFEGTLTFGPKKASFSLISAAGVPAAKSGFLVESDWTRAIEPGDTLVLGGKLDFQSTRFLTSIAENEASIATLPAPAEELAELADCTTLADLLASATGGSIYTGCNEACALMACEAAIETAWARASGADATLTGMTVAVSGAALAFETARISEFTGTWLGTLTATSGSVRGPASGLNDEP